MLKSLATSLALMTLAIVAAGCATTTAKPEGSAAPARPLQPTSFESWAVGNGTGSFFRPVGPGGGAGVRSSW